MRVDTMNTGKLAEAVRVKRKEKGLTQKALGEMFGLSQTYVGWLELGHVKRLDEDNVKRILSFLKINLADYTDRGKKQIVNDKTQAVKKVSTPYMETVVPEKKIPTPPVGSAVLEKRLERAPSPPMETTTSFEKKTGQSPSQVSKDRWSSGSGKERKRFAEWKADKTRIGIKLVNGEVVEGYMKWWDTYTLKLVTDDRELVIAKNSILYYIDAKKPVEQSRPL